MKLIEPRGLLTEIRKSDLSMWLEAYLVCAKPCVQLKKKGRGSVYRERSLSYTRGECGHVTLSLGWDIMRVKEGTVNLRT